VDLKNVLILPGIFALVVQMTPRYVGEARNVLMSALASEYHHPKVAIAVDEDVDIFNPTELLWALATRVNPQEDVVVVPGVRLHPMDPTGREIGGPGQPVWQRLGSKMLIDATKPALADPAGREIFARIHPPGHGTVFLKDFLGA
jgi:UbiD family decarboxylase